MTYKKTSFHFSLFLQNCIWHSAARTSILTSWKDIILHCSQCEKVFSNQQISLLRIPVCTCQLLPILIALLLLDSCRTVLNALERIKSKGLQELVTLVQLHTRWYLNGSFRDLSLRLFLLKSSTPNKPQILHSVIFSVPPHKLWSVTGNENRKIGQNNRLSL